MYIEDIQFKLTSCERGVFVCFVLFFVQNGELVSAHAYFSFSLHCYIPFLCMKRN